MYSIVKALLRVGLLFCLVKAIIADVTEGSFQPHCLQMSVGRRGKEVHDFLPIYINESAFPEPPPDAESILLEICPNKTTLKISWEMKRVSGNLKLCYKMKAIYNGRLLVVRCVKLLLHYSKYRTQMICWFPMKYLSERPIISAYIAPVESGHSLEFFDQLYTDALDETDSCQHVCDIPTIHIKNRILCNYKSYVEFDARISVRGLHLYPIDSANCMDRFVPINRQTSTRLEFELNCTFSGVVNLTIYYRIKGFFCHKYYPVRMICESAPTTSGLVEDVKKESSTYPFTTFGIAVFVLLIIVTTIIYCGIQRSREKSQRLIRNSDDIQVDMTDTSDRNDIPLNNTNSNSNKDPPDKDVNSETCLIEMITEI